MNKTKQRVMIILLLLVTVAVVFAPMAINALGNESRLGKKDYWQYNADENSKLTSRQVADLFYKNELSGSSVSANEYYDYEQARADAIRLIESVFAGNESVCNYLKSIVGDIQHCNKESMLIVTDNKPVALNLVSVSFARGDEVIELGFEEKTQTLIYFQFYNLAGEIDKSFPVDALMLSARDYYGGMALSDERYYFETSFEKDGWISFGLIEADRMEDYVT